jgi:hypothetical protein
MPEEEQSALAGVAAIEEEGKVIQIVTVPTPRRRAIQGKIQVVSSDWTVFAVP